MVVFRSWEWSIKKLEELKGIYNVLVHNIYMDCLAFTVLVFNTVYLLIN